MPNGKATSSYPRTTARRDLKSAVTKVGVFFVVIQHFFTLGDWGFFLAGTGYISFPTYETRGDGIYVQYGDYAHTQSKIAGSEAFY